MILNDDIDLSNLSAVDDVNVHILQELEDDLMILTCIICHQGVGAAFSFVYSSHNMRKPTMVLWVLRRLRSASAAAQSDQSAVLMKRAWHRAHT